MSSDSKTQETLIRWIPETTSTNSAVIEIAEREKLKTLVLAADHQTQGRGQFGRKWLSSPNENLLFSFYFKPRIQPDEAAPITQLACRAVLTVLTDLKLSCMIKPPNDILVNGKKICGILTEASSSGKHLNHIIIGIGLNVNGNRETLLPEATSIRIESGKEENREKILKLIVSQLKNELTSHFKIDFDHLVE
ncbi:MAG TPA: biotin--[acetyl-CoA-carboxylase] ligase [Candidatus Omnitrophota bacterium]|nr:biotin--[acetyl-CoA-carboxylase] ligase [Candidatus Omnitrophota bacterium]